MRLPAPMTREDDVSDPRPSLQSEIGFYGSETTLRLGKDLYIYFILLYFILLYDPLVSFGLKSHLDPFGPR